MLKTSSLALLVPNPPIDAESFVFAFVLFAVLKLFVIDANSSAAYPIRFLFW